MTALATSAGAPKRFIGTRASMLWANASVASFGRPMRPKIGVVMGPGLTAFTRIPRDNRSADKVLASERTAALAAEYTLVPAQPTLSTTDEFKIMDALSLRYGKACWALKNTPLTLMSKISSNSASVVSTTGANLATPALRNKTSKAYSSA